jgi:hypothetical protein
LRGFECHRYFIGAWLDFKGASWEWLIYSQVDAPRPVIGLPDQHHVVCYPRPRAGDPSSGPQLPKSGASTNARGKYFLARNNSVDGFALPLGHSRLESRELGQRIPMNGGLETLKSVANSIETRAPQDSKMHSA